MTSKLLLNRSETPQQSFQDNFVDTFQSESVDSDVSQHSERSKLKNPGNLKVQIEPKGTETKTKMQPATSRKTSLTSPLQTPENLQPVDDWALEVEINSPTYVIKEEPLHEAVEKPEETANASNTFPEPDQRLEDSAALLQSEKVSPSDQQLPEERFAAIVASNDVTNKSDDDDDNYTTADSDQE